MILTEKQFRARLAIIEQKHLLAVEAMERQIAAAAEMGKHTYLVSIERQERRIIFTFAVQGRLEQIECVGTWGDNLQGWRERLGLVK